VDQAIDLLRKVRAENPRSFVFHLWLAGALGFKSDLDEARTALAEAIRLKPEMNSLKQLGASSPGNSDYGALREKTFYVGLRRAGMPEE
jgi:tetratricopeptide (TPR) repeat protein